jgi:methyl-accepting chemotaxis protein
MSVSNQNFDPKGFEKEFKDRSLKRSDKLIEIFLGCYFVFGLCLAFFYDTWLIAIVSGGACVLVYFIAKKMFPGSNVHHYVASAVVGVYTGQFIYQMHGLFEMHFFAFIGSALMITYQNWKTQIPVALVVVVHHAIFGYLQYTSFITNDGSPVYFTQLDYMDLQTFIIHGVLATIVFFICSLWSYEMDKRTNETIENSKNILTVAQANDNVSKNLEYAIMLSEGMLEERIKYHEGDLMGEALSKIQGKLANG